MKPTLNLVEDKQKIRDNVAEYLEKHMILEWKYEMALSILIDNQLDIEPTADNLKKLGDIYLQECLIKYHTIRSTCNTDEKEKIESLQQHIQKICTSTRIKTLLSVANQKYHLIDRAIVSKIQTDLSHPQQEEFNHEVEVSGLESLSSTERMKFFCDKYGTNGHLDLTETKIPSRFGKVLLQTCEELNLRLKPMTTEKEKEMLMKICKCNSGPDIDRLLASLYAERNLDPTCAYIRLAIATVAELWHSRLLSKSELTESWLQTHVYPAVFDNAFIIDNSFTSKRADLYLNIANEFKDVESKQLDFVLRNVNDNNELSGHETADDVLKEGKAVQIALLKKWFDHLGRENVMINLEAIAYQWQGLRLTIYGTCLISNNSLLTYEMGSFMVPKDETHAGSIAYLLAAVLSIKRLAYINYAILNSALQVKYVYELETAPLRSNYESNLCVDSTADLEHSEDDDKQTNNNLVSEELDLRMMGALIDLKSEEGIDVLDWKEFIS